MFPVNISEFTWLPFKDSTEIFRGEISPIVYFWGFLKISIWSFLVFNIVYIYTKYVFLSWYLPKITIFSNKLYVSYLIFAYLSIYVFSFQNNRLEYYI